ncbi:MAG: hypothetical protein KDK10_03430 [Maritimibacter sp.]|nr:hypothetical protein [Maritimibacter sp.]
MKKILLASTILVGTAGFAAADNANFTFSGSAYVGAGYETAGGVFRPEIKSSFTASMVTMSDMGLEAGASITIDARGASFESDWTDGAFGTFSENGSSISNSSVYLKGDWGKLAVVYDDDGSGVGATTTDWDMVFTYSHTFGDFGVSAYYTVAIDGATGTNGDFGVKGTYSFGDYSVYAKVDYDNSDPAWSVGLGGSATFSGVTLGASVDYDNFTADWDWKATADYKSGAYGVGVFAEDDGVDDAVDYGIWASYDLGGGISVKGAYSYDQDNATGLAQLGVAMSF